MTEHNWQVLVVDDEEDSLQLVSKILSFEGIQVYTAHSGNECLAFLEKITPSLVVMDLAMPEMDGWELLNAIRADPKTASIRITAITAYHSEAVAEASTNAGFDGYFPKPIRPGPFMQHLYDLGL